MRLTHFEAMLLFALVISVAFALLSKSTLRQRMKYAAWAFLGFVAIGIALAWVMYFMRP